MKDPYRYIAPFYDEWQRNSMPGKWVNFTHEIIQKHCDIFLGQGEDGKLLVADLGCGTGAIAAGLSDKGYDLLCIDCSETMLSYGMDKFYDKNIRFIRQDITGMDLYGTVDIMICYMDTVNHITDPDALDRFFGLCKNYLNPGGLLIFDTVTEEHFSRVLNGNVFYEETDAGSLIWINHYDEIKKTNNAHIVTFIKEKDGSFSKNTSLVTEKLYDDEYISTLIDKNGLYLVSEYEYEYESPDIHVSHISAREKKGEVISDRIEEVPQKPERVFRVVKNKDDPQKEKMKTAMKNRKI